MPARSLTALVCLAAWAVAWPAVATAQLEVPRTFIPNDCVPAFRLAWGWCGDRGPATRALIQQPDRVTTWRDGAFALSSSEVAVIRKVDRQGVIDVVAGTGRRGFSGDGGPATQARISAPVDIAALPDGGLLIADTDNHRVRRVGVDGIIRTVAGTGRAGSAGDGGPALAAQLDHPTSVDALAGGGFVIGDSGNARVRRVAPDGTIGTAVITGRRTRTPNRLDVAALAGGGFVVASPVADTRVRRVAADGTITTIYRGALRGVTTLPDGSPAVLEARRLKGLDHPRSIALGRCSDKLFVPIHTGDGGSAARAVMWALDAASLPDGSVLVSDKIFQRIRRISPDGRVRTVAGGGGLRGRVPQWHTCGGAGGEISSRWSYFAIRSARRRRGILRVVIGTTLAAKVRLIVTRGRKPVATKGRRVQSGSSMLRVPRIGAGRYRFTLSGEHVTDQGERLRVRRHIIKRLR